MSPVTEDDITLLETWLKDYDNFLENDDDADGDEIRTPDLHPQHLDALESVLNAARIVLWQSR